ncbi:MAG: MFS transporter [Candidatus Lokiarchaeota archaeon]|nr:MFS transporter [Candidatus Lokiarchaeota archaeon]
MTESKPPSLKSKIIFGLSAIPDQLTYQAFTFLVFTYYFSIIDLNMTQLWVGFTIWGIWNAINDPLLGLLSDRTKFFKKFGKRRFYITISFLPLALMMIFIFTAPMGNQLFGFIYFMFIIILYEGIYTLYSVNVNALFPEMFSTEKQRASANIWVKLFTVLGLIFATVVPTLLIEPMVPKGSTTASDIYPMYFFNGILLAVVTLSLALPFVFFGIKERPEYKNDIEIAPNFLKAAKITLKNKAFIIFVIANTFVWYVFGLLPTVFPLYAAHVLEIPAEETFLSGLPLIAAFVVTAFVFPIHRKIGKKYGYRNAFIITLVSWIIALLPYIFLGSGDIILCIIFTAFMGFPLSGALYFVDILLGDIIDEDETKTGCRREGSYYGMNAFIHRLSILLKISTIAIVFQGTGWATYTPVPGLNVIFGLKLLMVLFPVIAIVVAIIMMVIFPLHGKKLNEMRVKLEEIHNRKIKECQE